MKMERLDKWTRDEQRRREVEIGEIPGDSTKETQLFVLIREEDRRT